MTLPLFLAICSTAVLAQQAPPEQPLFRIAVDVVSIDAVVTDGNGDVVRNLTAADFEVLQDGKRRPVTAAKFVAVTPDGMAKTEGVGSTKTDIAPAAGATGSPLTRQQVRRTLVVVVDDLGLTGQSMANLLAGLRRFVDAEVQPEDVAAIVRTGVSNGLLQSLTNDRRVLHAAIDALESDVQSRKGPWPFGDVVQFGLKPPEFWGAQRSLSATGSLIALSLVVQAASDLPGRKTVIFASEGLDLSHEDPRVRDSLGRVVDQAARSGVVIYGIDCVGLETGGLRASDDIHAVPDMTAAVRRFADARLNTIRDAQESLAYLAEQTGGFAVVNTNDLAGGLRRITADVRDYTGVRVRDLQHGSQGRTGDHALAGRRAADVESARSLGGAARRHAFLNNGQPDARPQSVRGGVRVGGDGDVKRRESSEGEPHGSAASVLRRSVTTPR